MSSARPVLPIRAPAIALFSVIAGFLAVTVIAQVHARAIDRLAREVSDRVAPGIDHLTAARGELHRIAIEARDALDHPEAATSHAAEVEQAKARLRAELAAYLAVAPHDAQLEQYRAAAQAVGAYEIAVAKLLANVEAARMDQARAIRDAAAMPAAERADAAVEELVRFDSGEAVALGRRIREARERATIFSYSLHALAALIAVVAVVLVLRFVSSREHLLEERSRLEAENQRLAVARADELEIFAARVAHDLKNPLAAIALRVTMAAGANAGEEKMRDALARTRANVERLNVIVDGLLDFARAGGRAIAGAHADLGGVVNALFAELELAAAAAHAELGAEPFRQVQLACPEWAATCALGNLLRNAVKFIVDAKGPLRRVTVRVREAGARVRVEVEDTGPGVPPAIARSMFEPYVRDTNSGRAGLGLGLATAKRVVEAYGGAIGASSSEACGARFWFELPKAAPSDAPTVEHPLH